MHRSLIGVILASGAHGAVSGVPEPPRPGPEPVVWGIFTNDYLVDRILDDDDGRTYGAALGGQWKTAALPVTVIAGWDYAVLTRRDRPDGTGDPTLIGSEASRVDEHRFSLGVGDHGIDQMVGLVRWQWAAGLGATLSGAYAGDRMQNYLHQRILHIPPAYLPYEYSRKQTAFAWARAGLTMAIDNPAMMREVGPGGLDLRLTGSLAPTARGGVPWDAALDLVSRGNQGNWWIGGRFVGFDRRTLSDTAASVARQEAGMWVRAGSAVLPSGDCGVAMTYFAEVNPRSGATNGGISFDWINASSLPSDQPTSPHPEDVRQSFLYAMRSTGYGVQIVWPSRWLGQGDWWAWDFLSEYRWGDAEDYEYRGNSVQADQFMLGTELRLRLPEAYWVKADIEGQVLTGARVERIAVVEKDADYTQDQSVRPASQLAVRSHLGFGPPGLTRLGRLRLGAGMHVVAPWWQARSEPSVGGSGGAAYQLPRWGWNMEISFLSRW
ncbi:hypothetical protein LBMAG53_36000 [Planctomycetota bacterium]|nr:hypothetical protein LBMAG53_36000 [Planctomycetota bacterium]